MNVPEGAQLSDDGYYWWDGNQWQPVDGGEPTGDGTGQDGVVIDLGQFPTITTWALLDPSEEGAREYLASLGVDQSTLGG